MYYIISYVYIIYQPFDILVPPFFQVVRPLEGTFSHSEFFQSGAGDEEVEEDGPIHGSAFEEVEIHQSLGKGGGSERSDHVGLTYANDSHVSKE